jgi:hypothetical protein
MFVACLCVGKLITNKLVIITRAEKIRGSRKPQLGPLETFLALLRHREKRKSLKQYVYALCWC